MIFTRKPQPETDFYQYFIFRHSKSIDPTLPFTRIFELFVKTSICMPVANFFFVHEFFIFS